MKYFVFLFLLILPIFAEATVQVAFIEARNYKGEVIQLETGGRFAHMAISYKNLWLHSHPIKGVELVEFSKLQKMGQVKEIITLESAPALTVIEINKYLGKAYDSEFSWSDDKIYCSELVAKLLKLEAEPMVFDPKLWPKEYERLNGEPGISPDDIYLRLSHTSSSCSYLFR